MIELIGLPLDTARAFLTEQGISNDKIIVQETAPPRAEKATGAWRVLRCRLLKNEFYEIVAAREQLSETRRAD